MSIWRPLTSLVGLKIRDAEHCQPAELFLNVDRLQAPLTVIFRLLFTWSETRTDVPPSGKSARTTNAIERLHEEFKRRIKTQTVLPSADTAAMLFWALLASGQINMRKIDGWQTLATKPIDQQIDLAA
jgi:transposase-like protein